MFIVGLLTVPVQLSLVVRRLHDTGYSGWFALLIIVIAFIPFINFLNFVVGLYLLFAPGQIGANKYGHQPNQEVSTKNIFKLK